MGGVVQTIISQITCVPVSVGKVACSALLGTQPVRTPSEAQVTLLCQTAKAHFACEILRGLDSLGKSGLICFGRVSACTSGCWCARFHTKTSPPENKRERINGGGGL